jgi:predicted small lipoprotein YifL
VPRIFSQRSPSTSLALIALVAITLALPGCGRRGALEAPPDVTGASASKPQSANRLTPGIGGATSRQNVADRDPLAPTSRLGEEADEPPVPAPNRPFILDAIL